MSVAMLCGLSGLSPFHRDTPRETLLAVQEGTWKFDEEAFSGISSELKDFISKLLVKDPKYVHDFLLVLKVDIV